MTAPALDAAAGPEAAPTPSRRAPRSPRARPRPAPILRRGAAREIRRLYRRIAMAPDLRPGPHIDPLLHRLVHFVVSIPPDHAPAILADPAVRALRPHLVALCARAEQELEAAWSAWVSASRVPPLTLLRFPYLDNYRQLTELEHTALARHVAHPPRRVLFVGSGPLPLSSLHLAGVLGTGTTIDNLDRGPAAIAGARRLTHRLDARRLAFHHGDLADLHDLRPYDLVVLAALVGLTATDKRRTSTVCGKPWGPARSSWPAAPMASAPSSTPPSISRTWTGSSSCTSPTPLVRCSTPQCSPASPGAGEPDQEPLPCWSCPFHHSYGGV